MKTKKHELLFVRHSGMDIETMTAIEMVTHPDISSRDQAIEALKKAVTAWIKNTPYGKEAWEDSVEDFNIGDLSMYFDEFNSLNPDNIGYWLHENGIGGLKILYQMCTDQVIAFDTILAEASELEEVA